MNKFKYIMSCALVLTFIAGIVTGWALDPFDKHNCQHDDYVPAWLNQELALSQEQQVQLLEIWSTRDKDNTRGNTTDLSKAKDAQVVAILTDKQKPEYENIMAEFRKNKKKEEDSRRFKYDTAIEETENILNEEQQKKFKELITAQKSHGRLPLIHNSGRGQKNKKHR